ncbi:hypothetical protein DACRYDRAFT_20164 [Dacryopinax primogenitus]|uniref:Uncharacterized protein n=1 Tax=Dacryopinax primogenitus (strain DJM 731) TaxID=1858805 RepID=M5GEX5_DACPD|nr:uncharacterized protein DACRYDRAFT_20164 [Dacryopinax primogenitus]EJU05782.1 hypothetical protein DACRYDRAFT_20164 [Dacryopinax primogenitus]
MEMSETPNARYDLAADESKKFVKNGLAARREGKKPSKSPKSSASRMSSIVRRDRRDLDIAANVSTSSSNLGSRRLVGLIVRKPVTGDSSP